MLVAAHDVPDMARRPVTLLADHLGRPRVRVAHVGGPVVIVPHGVIELPHATQLRFYKGADAGTHMTLDACDFRVDARLRSNEFRFHRDVAGLTAEFDRLRVMIGFVTSEGGHEEE